MADDVLINKAATIERCVKRAREEYARDPATFDEKLGRAAQKHLASLA